MRVAERHTLAHEPAIELADLSDAELAEISEHLVPQVREVLTVAGSISSRDGRGGTAPVRVVEQLARAAERADELRAWAQGE